MKSLCLDARLLSAPGIGSYLKNLLKHIAEWPLEVSALVHASDLDKFALGEAIRPIIVKSPIYSLSEQWELPIKIPKADVFWSPHYNVPALPIRAKRRLTTIHDVYHLAFNHTLSLQQKVYAKWMFGQSVGKSHRVITDSHFSEAEIMRFTSIDPKKMRVVHLGVDHLIFHSEVPKAAKEKFPVLQRRFILSVGSGKSHKNGKGVLEAFLKLPNEDIDLVYVGNKIPDFIADRPHLRGRVHFLGYVEDRDLALLYRSADMLAFPSYYEGFGIPPLEAMCCGCPVIASRAASLPEICGDAAWYVDPGSAEELAEAMQVLLENDMARDSLTAKGLERAKQFVWKNAADAHLKIIEEMLP